MKKLFALALPALLALTSCKESIEDSRYANWQARNEAFIDSIANRHANTSTREQLDSIHLLSAPGTPIYFKRKATAPADAADSPRYTDYVKVFYKGTNILGEYFDGNFKGSDPIEAGESSAVADSKPFITSLQGLIVGWKEVLQRMRPGDRWEVYIPWTQGYGESGSGNIRGYSTLVFDLTLIESSPKKSDL